MDMNLSKLWEIVEDRGAWLAAVHGEAKDSAPLSSRDAGLLEPPERPQGPWTAAHEAPVSSTISQSLLKFMSIGSVMASNHLILCYSLLLLPSVFPQHQGLFHTYTSDFTGGCPPPPLSEKELT